VQEGEEDQRVIFMGEILSREEEGEGGASNMEQALNLTLGSGPFLEKFCFLCKLRATLIFIFKRVSIIFLNSDVMYVFYNYGLPINVQISLVLH
jgi:hypothetical protein